MSRRLISRSGDLKRLQDEGFDLEIKGAYLLVRDVPYVNAQKELRQDGVLVFKLVTAGETTAAPHTHVAMFVGEFPCDSEGARLPIQHSGRQNLLDSLSIDFSFSSKPVGGGNYPDYYEQVASYVAMLEGPAQSIDSDVTAKTFPAIVPDDDEAEQSVFKYLDTATSRANIGVASSKLENQRIAIVGVGGTGSYVLDLVAKTHVKEIHLFDGDAFLSHNAFRAPGASSLEELNRKPAKVHHLAERYGVMRNGIVPHAYQLDSSNVDDLNGFDFVFLCVDANPDKRSIVDKLEAFDIPFADTGMGVDVAGGAIAGIARVTASLPGRREVLRERAPMGGSSVQDDYASNVQIAELNALSAAFAVIRWKKLFGFYHDQVGELDTTYTIDCNMVLNEGDA